MKKLLSLVLVLTFVFGGTAIAAEKFNLSGQYRMEMYNLVDDDMNSSVKDDKQYVDQRFRLQFDFTPAENVKAVLRGDFAEANWGTVSNTTTPTAFAATTTTSGIGYRTDPAGGTIMIDKAYVDLQTAMVNWKVGLFPHVGFGKAVTTDNQGANVMITADFAPVSVTALWTKVEEGTALTDDVSATAADEDRDIYGVQVAYKSDAFGAGVLYAMDDDKNASTAGDQKTVFGVFGDATFGMLSMWAEYDMYGGDNGGAVNYVGNNFFFHLSAALSDQLTLGGDVIWAAGESDAADTTLPYLTWDQNYQPFDHGPFNAVTAENTGIQTGVAPFEADAGSQALNIFATFAATEALTVYGNFGYLKPDVEDPNGDLSYYDTATVFGIAAKYTFLPGTAFSVKYRNMGMSGTTGLPDDSETLYAGMLSVNF
jgi:hypothetical protein